MTHLCHFTGQPWVTHSSHARTHLDAAPKHALHQLLHQAGQLRAVGQVELAHTRAEPCSPGSSSGGSAQLQLLAVASPLACKLLQNLGDQPMDL